MRPAAFSRRTQVIVALAAAVAAMLVLVDVRMTGPIVAVQWDPAIAPAARTALERRYGLRNGEVDEGTTWRYDLGDRSRGNIGALVRDPAVRDTGYIDREALTARPRDVQVGIRSIPYPFSDRFDRPSQLLRLHSTVWLVLAGGVLLWVARSPSARRRRAATVATLLLVGVVALAFPISPALVHMGDSEQIAGSREAFEGWVGVRAIRYEAHLSYAILGQLYRLAGATDDAPVRAEIELSRAATGWFVLCALAVGALERWSPMVVRYLGLALLAPGTLLYFGWREAGYLSLNVATFPLLARGLRDGGWRLEGGSVLAGFGAALHGLGLVSLTGAWLAALATRGRVADRIVLLLRIAAWGTAAYVGWIAIYLIVLKLPIALGHASYFPWRPWFADVILEGRVNAAIFSAIGARDLLFSGWVVGAPVLVLAASLWRKHRDCVRVAMAYAVASVVFTICSWPVLGLGQDLDLVFAAFPAFYAAAWVCAHDSKRTYIAAALLVSAHYAFWRICLDPRFRNAALF
jgi:hypothetical protein